MRQDATKSGTAPVNGSALRKLGMAVRFGAAMLFGVVLIALAYQLPVTHSVDIGGRDAAYTQGFFGAIRNDIADPDVALVGSDGRARWSQAESFLVFPQIGLPAELTLRLRAAPQAAPDAQLHLFLNNQPLGSITPRSEWDEYRFPINSGLTKPSDVVIALRSPTSPASADDQRAVGVLLDHATLRTVAWPIMPYPAQLLFGVLAGGFLALLWLPSPHHPTILLPYRPIVLSLLAVALAFLLLYRIQPWYGYPLRNLLLLINAPLAALVALRFVPLIAARIRALADAVALASIGMWISVVGWHSRQHVTLSLPGVENDFGVFARRSEHLFGLFQTSGVYDAASDGVLRADGFYNLGYPFLLWLVRPFAANNPFLAGRMIAAASSVVLLLATWWLARQLLGRGSGFVALLLMMFSPLVVQYSLYVGTDMPFAALCTIAVALLVGGAHQPPAREHAKTNTRLMLVLVGAGLAAGAAFLVRHPGIVLLPFGWLVVWLAFRRDHRLTWKHIGLFTLAFAVVISPQLFLNLRDTGSPLWSQQAKNIWLAVYANGDWSRWEEAPNSIGFVDVVLADPVRFFAHWLTNLRGFIGAGGEDVSEFGRADQLRLLAFPANWLAIGGLGAWALWHAAAQPLSTLPRRLLLWLGLYVVGVTVGLSIVRFALPLVPVYAIGAAWSIGVLGGWLKHWLGHRAVASKETHTRPLPWSLGAVRAPLFVGMVVIALLSGGFAQGTRVVLANQRADEVAAIALVQQAIRPGEYVQIELDDRLRFKYSAVGHVVTPDGAEAALVLRKESAAQAGEDYVGSAGGYALFRKQI